MEREKNRKEILMKCRTFVEQTLPTAENEDDQLRLLEEFALALAFVQFKDGKASGIRWATDQISGNK